MLAVELTSSWIARQRPGSAGCSSMASVGGSKSVGRASGCERELEDVGVIQLAEIASVLGYEISLGWIRWAIRSGTKGQLGGAAERFSEKLSEGWRVTDETLLPGAGELRAGTSCCG